MRWGLCLAYPQHGLEHYFKTHYADKTFEHLYRWNSFDTALLVPYFIVMVILAFYGIHRYQLVYRYYKNRKNAVREPESHFAELPTVTLQLPIFNEQFVVDRLIQACCNLEYPADKLEIQVLDDSTDDTVEVAKAAVELYQSLGHRIVYIHRVNRHGFKAGALDEGLRVATGEFVAIFDADFVPPKEWLMQVVHHFANPKIGMVQTRWTHLNRDYSFLTQVEAILLDGHFVLEHGGRSRTHAFFNFNGTAGMWRRVAIDGSGGWQHDTLTEDTDLSYRAQLKGWRFVYIPSVDCPSELPVDTYGFQVQQSRWAKGLTQVAIKLLPRILRSKEPWRVKLEAFCHLTPNISYPLMLIMSALMLPVMIVRFYMGVFQMLTVDLPLIVASFCSLWAFYLMAQHELHPRNWKRAIALMPALMAAGIALTLINTKAVIEALLGIKSAFARTPKYAVGDNKVKIQNESYRRRSGWLPYGELAMGGYFAYMVAYAIETWNFLAIPFLMLFVVGYWWAGFTTLYQEYQGKLQWQREQALNAGLGLEPLQPDSPE
jgi:cellulose synthase/poly-beta-1,6-N-acetylglucosamine synthase-like glycosyltransferase